MRSLRCKRLSSSTGFFPDCQFFEAHSVYVTPAITSRTGRNCAELCLRFFLISIYFPVTGAFECPRPILDKAFDIIRGITEKQANLMGEFMELTQAQRQLCKPPPVSAGTYRSKRARSAASAAKAGCRAAAAVCWRSGFVP